jgi:hypothetical protein
MRQNVTPLVPKGEHQQQRVMVELKQERKELVILTMLTLVHRSCISYTLKMEAIPSSETSVNKISTRRPIPEDGILNIFFCFCYFPQYFKKNFQIELLLGHRRLFPNTFQPVSHPTQRYVV